MNKVRFIPQVSGIATLVLTLVALSGVAVSAGGPPGSVKLPPSQVTKVGSITCGKIGKAWYPGTYKIGWFLTLMEEADNLSAKAKRTKDKRKKAKLYKKADKLRKKAKQLKPICNGERPGPLRFDIDRARGLALLKNLGPAERNARAKGYGGRSNLDAVQADGDTEDAAISGTAEIRKFLIAPDETVYLLFEQPVNLEDSTDESNEATCLLARVDPDTGKPSCVDGDLHTIFWEDLGGWWSDGVQFGPDGAIFYTGSTRAGKTVLRRVMDGKTTDLITDYVYIWNWVAAPDGSVFLAGYTTTGGSGSWTRRVTPGGGLQTVFAGEAGWLDVYPDGNVYMGYDNAVRRFLSGSAQLDPKHWISSGGYHPTAQRYFDADTYCPGEAPLGWCRNPSGIGGSATTSDDQVFVSTGGGLVRFFPTPEFPDVSVRPGEFTAAGTKLVLSGLNAADQSVISVYDTVSDQETTLLGPANETEVYHLSYSPSTNEVLFDGLRFADNTYVLGRIDMDTNEVTVFPAGATRWEDFQAFG